MTTHLVIADLDTLTRLIRAAKGNDPDNPRLTVDVYEDVPLGAYLPWRQTFTGDRWWFRAPESVRKAMYRKGDPLRNLPKPLHVYAAGPSRYHAVTPLLISWDRVLPLIAACDLLGVDEL